MEVAVEKICVEGKLVDPEAAQGSICAVRYPIPNEPVRTIMKGLKSASRAVENREGDDEWPQSMAKRRAESD